ncbi:MAG: hypothetical protein ACOCP8_07095 [archaeon]
MTKKTNMNNVKYLARQIIEFVDNCDVNNSRNVLEKSQAIEDLIEEIKLNIES